ncbi:MAG TPA: GNAT family N-acetyltransferase [Kofleriaceae bacterium]|nr:GNAT family N-acetyltransferase [Kofleriaceae bacterium]
MARSTPSFSPYDKKDGKPYIFVCYSRKDHEVVVADLELLSRLGFRIWYDQHIPGAKNWEEEVEDHIKGCRVFMIFVSTQALASPQVKDEIGVARAVMERGGAPILPIFLEGNIEPSLKYSFLTQMEGLEKFKHATPRAFHLALKKKLDEIASETRDDAVERDLECLGLGCLPTTEDVLTRRRPSAAAQNERRSSLVLDMHKEGATAYRIANVFQLTSEATQALDHLKDRPQLSSDPGKPTNLVTLPLQVDEVYLSPLRLVKGLITRLDENWPPLVASYSRLAKKRTFSALDDLHYYIEFCWLAWGPSVVTTALPDGDDAFMVVQAAFGDEANSLPLILKKALWRRLEVTLSKRESGWPVRLDNVLIVRPGSDDFFGAVRHHPLFEDMFSDPTEIALYLPCDDAPYADGEVRALSEKQDAYYSTAYVWLMLAQVPHVAVGAAVSERLALEPGKVIPFFEHANLATSKGLLFLEHCLARKAIYHVLECENDPDYRSEGYYRFATALFPQSMVNILGEEIERLPAAERETVRRRLHIPTDSQAWSTPVDVVRFADAVERVVHDAWRASSRATAPSAGVDEQLQARIAARELTAAPDDLALLRRFYSDLYVHEFPDPNERESVENMERYLQRKAEGWYRNNNYHILLYLDGDAPVAGAIIDYLAEPNAGIIEFLVVSPARRRTGLGRQTLHWLERIIDEDSRRAGFDGYSHLLAEMNDPFKLSGEGGSPDSMDAFQRAAVWHRWGFSKLRFPYVQPSLSPDQQPVGNLLLLCKPGPRSDAHAIASTTLRDAVYGYARWAMRIEDPARNEECRAMAGFLAARPVVELLPLDRYTGAPGGRLALAEQVAADAEALDVVLDIYAREFHGGPTTVSQAQFHQVVADARRRAADPDADHDYHLLSIAEATDGPPRGMASFFTFPRAGFVGYVVLDPAIRYQGYLSEVVTAIERTMVVDDRGARGWYGECDPAGPAGAIFVKQGCREVDVVYRQPPLPGQDAYPFDSAPVLRLMYKELGETFAPPAVATTDFLSALRWIFRVVYRVDHPQDSPYYRDIERQLRGSDAIGWK